MSVFQCQWCGCEENTALSSRGFQDSVELFDWTYAPERKGLLLCSCCGPTHYQNGEPTRYGRWHNRFTRVFFPLHEFVQADDGILRHKEAGLSTSEFKKKFPKEMMQALSRQIQAGC